MKYYGPGHTSGDSVVTFQNANIVHMGDLMFYLRNPRVDRGAGASIRNWIVTLESVTKEHPADTIYIAGHAKANLPVTVTRADLLKFRDYFTGLLGYVQKGIASGRPAAEIVKVASVPGFADYEGSPEGTIQAAYDELTAKG
jgi:cyclase